MRIMILTFDNIYTGIILNKLFSNFGNEIACIVLSDSLIHGKSTLRGIKKILKESTIYFLLFKFIEMFSYELILRKKLHFQTIEAFAKDKSIPVIRSKDVNSQSFIKQVKKIKPDLIISINFNQIIKEELLNIPRMGCINIHPALLPKYRGLFPYYWVLANNERTAGITVHYMEKGLDSGDIIEQQEIHIDKDDSVFSLNCRLNKIGAGLLVNAINKMKNGSVVRTRQTGEGSYYSWPTYESYKNIKKNYKKLIKLKDLTSKW